MAWRNCSPPRWSWSTVRDARSASRRSEMVDRAIRIASLPDVIFTSYGDMLRVPGSESDLLQVKGQGGDVRIVYSPMDAVNLARTNPDRRVAFFGVGFETTAPANAMAVWQAKRMGLNNFSMLVSHVLVPPAMRLILSSPSNRVQGFIGPGHVCTVMGYQEYDELANEFRVPIVVGGFEPVDLLEAIHMLVSQLEEGRARGREPVHAVGQLSGKPASAENHARGIRGGGSKMARHRVHRESGFGYARSMPASMPNGYSRSKELSAEEPEGMHQRPGAAGTEKAGGLPGLRHRCTPMSPLGAPMVSTEGACAAYHQYRRHTCQVNISH